MGTSGSPSADPRTSIGTNPRSPLRSSVMHHPLDNISISSAENVAIGMSDLDPEKVRIVIPMAISVA